MTGGIAGFNRGSLSYCENRAEVSGNNRTGGIAGYSEYGTVSHCDTWGENIKFSYKLINQQYNVAGGIVGETYYGKVEYCVLYGTIRYMNASSSSTVLQPRIGQIIGYSYQTTRTSNGIDHWGYSDCGYVDNGTLQIIGSHNQYLYAAPFGFYGKIG